MDYACTSRKQLYNCNSVVGGIHGCKVNFFYSILFFLSSAESSIATNLAHPLEERSQSDESPEHERRDNSGDPLGLEGTAQASQRYRFARKESGQTSRAVRFVRQHHEDFVSRILYRENNILIKCSIPTDLLRTIM